MIKIYLDVNDPKDFVFVTDGRGQYVPIANLMDIDSDTSAWWQVTMKSVSLKYITTIPTLVDRFDLPNQFPEYFI